MSKWGHTYAYLAIEGAKRIAELQAENERLRRTIEEYDDMLDTIKGVFE